MEHPENQKTISEGNLSITIVSDNNSYDQNLETAWGFSAFVKGAEKTILFDTGVDGPILLRNMEKLNINPKEIDVVVLSHIHQDHVGGLESFLGENSDVDVYVPQSFPVSFKENIEKSGAMVSEVDDVSKICKNVYSTGEMGMFIKEQSLIIKTDKGLIVVTGCAHPGIVKIIKKTKESVKDDVLLVLGGFHLRDDSESKINSIISDFNTLSVKYAAPTHCSGDLARQLFENEYNDNFILAGVGKTINMDDLK